MLPKLLCASCHSLGRERPVLGTLRESGVDRQRIGAAERIRREVLGRADVHHDVALHAREDHTSRVGGRRHHFVAVDTVEDQRVDIAVTVDLIAAVALVPDDGVVAGAADVGFERLRRTAGAARERIVVRAAVEEVRAVAAMDLDQGHAGEREVVADREDCRSLPGRSGPAARCP